jgi:hypothetical protein
MRGISSCTSVRKFDGAIFHRLFKMYPGLATFFFKKNQVSPEHPISLSKIVNKEKCYIFLSDIISATEGTVYVFSTSPSGREMQRWPLWH